jgi:hypothetical protein
VKDSGFPGRVELRLRDLTLVFSGTIGGGGGGMESAILVDDESLIDSDVFSLGRGLLGGLGRTGLGFFGSEIARRWALDGCCVSASGGGCSGGMKVFSS